MKTWNKPEIEEIEVAMTMQGNQPSAVEKEDAEIKYYSQS